MRLRFAGSTFDATIAMWWAEERRQRKFSEEWHTLRIALSLQAIGTTIPLSPLCKAIRGHCILSLPRRPLQLFFSHLVTVFRGNLVLLQHSKISTYHGSIPRSPIYRSLRTVIPCTNVIHKNDRIMFTSYLVSTAASQFVATGILPLCFCFYRL